MSGRYCHIEIQKNTARLTGNFDLALVRSVTSYPVPGAWFSPQYKAGRWDGREHLFHLRTQTMPAGLVKTVVTALRADDKDIKITISDSREDSIPVVGNNGFQLHDIQFGEGKYDYQLEAAVTAIEHKRCILKMATNAGKTAISAAVTKHLSIPTVFIVPSLELMYQTQRKFAGHLNIPKESIGLIGDGHFDVGDWITIAILDSFHSRLASYELQEALGRWQLLWVDECHVAGSETCYEVLNAIPAYYRFGLSGTPLDRSDGASLRLIAQTGDVAYEIRNKLLVDRGISVQPYVEFVRVDSPKLPEKLPWKMVQKKGICENMELNQKLVAKTHKYASQGLQCIFMIELKNHGKTIELLMRKLSPDYKVKYLDGTKEGSEREQALKDFKTCKIRVLIVTSILNQGVDLDNIDVLIFGSSGKATIPVLQRSGRGLRTGRGRDKLIIVDVVNFCHKHLTKHSLIRLKTYKSEECFKISMEEENAIPQSVAV